MTETGCSKIKTDLTTDASLDISKIVTLAAFTSDDNESIMKSIDVFNAYDTTKKADISGNTLQIYFAGVLNAKDSIGVIMDSFDSTKTDTYIAGFFEEIKDFWIAVNAN